MMPSAQQLLKQYKIPVTEQRLAILSLFVNSCEPFNHNLLDKQIGKVISRYTIYRSLKLFLKKGVLHSLPSEDGIIWYALPSDNQAGQTHPRMRFLCRACGKMFCLADNPLPEIKVSKQFMPETIEIIIKGLCTACK